MKQLLYERVWTFGLRLRNRAKGSSVFGRIEPSLLKLAPKLVPPPKTEISVRLPHGMSMKVPPGYPVGRSYSGGMYEPAVTELFGRMVQKGMTVVDAGANIGYYSLLASRLVGAGGQVYSFEPDSANYSYLLANLESNGCSNVTAVPRALSNTIGTARFIRDPYGAEGCLSEKADDPRSVDVPTSTLDGFFEERAWPPVALIKMDIEGGEPRALEGMRELSRRNPALTLIMEWNAPAISRSGVNVDSVAPLLHDLGFVSGCIIETVTIAFSVATQFPRRYSIHNLLLTKAGQHAVALIKAPT